MVISLSTISAINITYQKTPKKELSSERVALHKGVNKTTLLSVVTDISRALTTKHFD
jgi:hypothetical protein